MVRGRGHGMNCGHKYDHGYKTYDRGYKLCLLPFYQPEKRDFSALIRQSYIKDVFVRCSRVCIRKITLI